MSLVWLGVIKIMKFDKGPWGLVRLFLGNENNFKVFKSLQTLERNKIFSSNLKMALCDLEVVLEKSWTYIEVVLMKSWSKGRVQKLN